MRKKIKELERKENIKPTKGNVYIFCEGEETEHKYFNSFKSDICKGRSFRRKLPEIKVIPTKNCGALTNIEHINDYAEHQSLSDRDGDCLISIIDCDANKKEDLNKAVKMANGNTDGIKTKVNICLSNPSFEIWFLCHYECYTRQLDQKTLENRLKKHIKDYQKNVDYYHYLKDHKNDAIKNAEYLRQGHSKNGIELLSLESNPSTMVPYVLEHVKNFIK